MTASEVVATDTDYRPENHSQEKRHSVPLLVGLPHRLLVRVPLTLAERVVVFNSIHQPACRVRDGHCAVPHGVQLVQAAGLKPAGTAAAAVVEAAGTSTPASREQTQLLVACAYILLSVHVQCCLSAAR